MYTGLKSVRQMNLCSCIFSSQTRVVSTPQGTECCRPSCTPKPPALRSSLRCATTPWPYSWLSIPRRCVFRECYSRTPPLRGKWARRSQGKVFRCSLPTKSLLSSWLALKLLRYMPSGPALRIPESTCHI